MADTNAAEGGQPEGTAFGPGIGGASVEVSGTATVRGGATLFSGGEDGGSKIGSAESGDLTVEFRVTATFKGGRKSVTAGDGKPGGEVVAGSEDGGHGIGHPEESVGKELQRGRPPASQTYDASQNKRGPENG